jgi:L-asparagine transporter-like permease
VNIASSLTNVGVFAGAFTFGTLLNLSNTLENFDLVSQYLSIAFLLFATSLFLAISIQILLRRDEPSQAPPQRKMKLFVFHISLVSGLLVAGFIVLDLVLMEIGQKAVGVTGIVLLCLIAAWIGVVWYAESTEMLEDKGCCVVENQQSTSKEET